jgi:hypothetical protein
VICCKSERERKTKINSIIKRSMVNSSIIAILAAVILAASTEVAITTAATVYGQQPQKDRSDNGGLTAALNATNYVKVKGDTVAVNGINATTNATWFNVAFWRCYLNATITLAPGDGLNVYCPVYALSTDRVIVTNNDGLATVMTVFSSSK